MWYYAKNGTQEGPISQESLVEMLQGGQLAGDALVWRDGMNEWLPANQISELRSELTDPAPAAAPLSPAGSGPMAAQPSPGLAYAQPPQTNSMALTSMVLGICGIVVAGIFTAIPAIICGHIARKQIREANGTQSGEGMATAGLITGYLATILTIVVVVGIIIFIVMVADASTSGGRSMLPTPAPPPSAPVAPAPMPAPTPGVP